MARGEDFFNVKNNDNAPLPPGSPSPSLLMPRKDKCSHEAMGSRGVDVAGKQHPFIDRAQISTIVTGPFRLYSPSGGLVAAVVRHAYLRETLQISAVLSSCAAF